MDHDQVLVAPTHLSSRLRLVFQTPNIQSEEVLLAQDPELSHRISPVPPAHLEPLDLDLAVAQANNFDKDVGFNLNSNPVDSEMGRFPPAKPISIAPEILNSNHEAFESEFVLYSGKRSESKTIDRPKHSTLKKCTSSKARIEMQVHIFMAFREQSTATTLN